MVKFDPNNNPVKFEKNRIYFRGGPWPLKFLGGAETILGGALPIFQLLDMVQSHIIAQSIRNKQVSIRLVNKSSV